MVVAEMEIRNTEKVSAEAPYEFLLVNATCPLWTSWSPLPVVAEV
jgi:hypothetical protein